MTLMQAPARELAASHSFRGGTSGVGAGAGGSSSSAGVQELVVESSGPASKADPPEHAAVGATASSSSASGGDGALMPPPERGFKSHAGAPGTNPATQPQVPYPQDMGADPTRPPYGAQTHAAGRFAQSLRGGGPEQGTQQQQFPSNATAPAGQAAFSRRKPQPPPSAQLSPHYDPTRRRDGARPEPSFDVRVLAQRVLQLTNT